MALGLLWLGFRMTLAWWGGPLGEMVDVTALDFLPPRMCGWLVAGGVVVGAAGGYAATMRNV